MAPEKSPAFQFYPKEFLMDGNVASMSLQERGAYITLLCICWQERSLPNEPGRLANIVGLPLKAFQKIWPHLAGCFVQQGERLLHPRLEKEREKQTKFSQRQADAANARHGKPKASQVDAAAHAEPVPDACSPVSDLRSPISDLRKESVPRAPLALAGTLPRDHVGHGWCSSRGKCVPTFLHEEFIRSVGGERKPADQRLRVFYQAVEAGWPEGPIGDDPVKLWRREFAASFPSVAPVSTQRQQQAVGTFGRSRGLIPESEPLV